MGPRVRILDQGSSVVLWASAADTYHWATRPDHAWPCSSLRGVRFCAVFDSNGLLELTINGKSSSSRNVDAHELSAICADFLDCRIASSHPAWYVAVGQFKGRS